MPKGITKEHLITTTLMVVWLVICTVILTKLHIHDKWPAFLAVIFFFNVHFDTSSLKTIFGAGAMGLSIGYTMPIILSVLAPIVGGEIAFYMLIGIVLFVIIGLGPIARFLFNPVTFTYALLALLHLKEVPAHTFQWLGIHFLGGALCISGIYGIVRMMNKNGVHDGEATH
ncbi:hypothetical protein CCE28_01805 [Anaeromicrobium sediminis]|uniref:DUF1097 domain-containing protein n=2 Tax=Anaeromicrobium sediminis TaxID=1478221 RepID=A0A267MNR9_9FIRM|nr:hypothetical protein CCE28_01805 [Anaeromicrobium sediminis]